MTSTLLPMGKFGAIENNGTVTFGVCLPWVSASDGNQVSVKVIHERDQFLQAIPAREFPMTHSMQAPYGDYWSRTGSHRRHGPRRCRVGLGSAGELSLPLLRPATRTSAPWTGSSTPARASSASVSNRHSRSDTSPISGALRRRLEDPGAGGPGHLRAEHCGVRWRPRSHRQLMAYLRDLGVNAIEVMPLSNVGETVDWGYLPIGYFGIDERFGKRSDFQALVDTAHQNGIAVIVDMVYGHAGVDFPYYDLYMRLQYRENPFMGPFAKDYFSAFGKSTDFARPLTRDYFFSVNHHWLHVYHVDGIRYDCVPNYWDGPLGVGYANLVYETYKLTEQKVAAGDTDWTRFDGRPGPLRLIQCAEQLEGPEEVLATTYSNCTWQNRTFDAARAVARGDRGQLESLGLQLGLFGYPSAETTNGDDIPKSALQYLENHDHERFICNFGLYNPDEAKVPLVRRKASAADGTRFSRT